MAQRLIDKVALVTGAGSGIGLAICQAFAAEGAIVVCSDIDAASAAHVATAISAGGGQADHQPLDVSDSEAVATVVASLTERYGALHVIVSGAAVLTPTATLVELSEQDWRKTIDVNLSGAFFVCKHAIPLMIKTGGGSIILIASQMGRVANAGQTAYCTTKGALLQMAKGMALDHAGDNIRVNTLSPGGTATPRLAKRFGDLDQAEKLWGPKHPLGRLGRAEEMAHGAVYLASDDSSFMTGADLLIDGGYSAW